LYKKIREKVLSDNFSTAQNLGRETVLASTLLPRFHWQKISGRDISAQDFNFGLFLSKWGFLASNFAFLDKHFPRR